MVRFNFVLRMRRCIPEFICNVSGMFGILYERCAVEKPALAYRRINRSKRNEFCEVRPENPQIIQTECEIGTCTIDQTMEASG